MFNCVFAHSAPAAAALLALSLLKANRSTLYN